MSAVSKYYKITEQLLLEYIPADLNAINMKVLNDSEDYMPSKYIIYEGNDTNIYYTQYLNNSNYRSKDFYSLLGALMKYPDESDSEHTFAGIPTSTYTLTNQIKDYAYSYTEKTYDGSPYYYDTIRIHFIYGFTLDFLQGLALSVQGHASYKRYDYKINTHTGQYLKDQYGNYIIDKTVDKITDTTMVTLLDYFLPKELLKDAIHWDANPLYLNSKFYDRFIDVKFPSYYLIACDKNIDFTIHTSTDEEGEETTYVFNPSEPIVINCATVGQNNTTKVIDATKYAKSFILDSIVSIGIKPISNSEYFNIRIYENPYENNIIYYPTYGNESLDSSVPIYVLDLSLDVMNEIESGAIPMVDQSYHDINYNEEEFYEMYGENARKWIVYNELTVIYNYNYYLTSTSATNTIDYSYTQYFTNIIDYAGKTPEDGDFWRSTFVPSIRLKNNMTCTSVIIQYTCRLVNRLNGAEAIRSASIRLDDLLLNRYKLVKLNLDGMIATYKVINRINKQNIYQKNEPTLLKEKFIRSYYDATDLVVKDVESGFAYTLGKMTLRLKHSSTNYCLRIFYLNSDNVRIPYDLTGPYMYKLVFSAIDGTKIEIKPNNDNKNYKLGIGSLVYYITSDLVKRIMSVNEKDRYFAIVVDTNNSDAQLTTLYEGKVDYYTE